MSRGQRRRRTARQRLLAINGSLPETGGTNTGTEDLYIYSLILLKKKVFVMTTNSPKV